MKDTKLLEHLNNKIEQLRLAIRVGYEEGFYNPSHNKVILELEQLKTKLIADKDPNKHLDLPF